LEKEIVIPLEIFNSDSFVIQTLKLMEDRKVFGKGRRFLGGEKIPKTEEEFEKVTQDHQMANLLFL
jgi:hypothetical protein